MLCANTVPPSLKHLIKNYDGNYGKTCCAFWRATSFLQGPADASPAPLNIAQRPTLCLTNHDAILLKSPTAADTGKADAAIIEVLTKGHSILAPIPRVAKFVLVLQISRPVNAQKKLPGRHTRSR